MEREKRVHPQLKITLAAERSFFGPGVYELMARIDQTASLQEACKQMNLSYSKGSKMMRNIDQQLGFSVVQRRAGGKGGGGSTLTEEGRKLLEDYKKMVEEIEKNADTIFDKYFGTEPWIEANK